MDVISVQRRATRGKLGYCNLITRPLDDCELKTCKQHSRALRRHTAVTDGTHLQPQAAQKIMNRLLKEGRGGTGNHAVTPTPFFHLGGGLKKKEKKRQKEGKKGGGGLVNLWSEWKRSSAASRQLSTVTKKPRAKIKAHVPWQRIPGRTRQRSLLEQQHFLLKKNKQINK